MRTVHLQTTVSAVFAVLDKDAENAVPQEPIVVQINRFDPGSFADAHKAIKQRHDELVKEAEPPAELNRAARRARK